MSMPFTIDSERTCNNKMEAYTLYKKLLVLSIKSQSRGHELDDVP